jgi:tetratricopeptide (TPR) repeat protein
MNSTDPDPTAPLNSGPNPAKPKKSCAFKIIGVAAASGLLSAALTTVTIVEWSSVVSSRKQAKAAERTAAKEAFVGANGSMTDVYREDIKAYTKILKMDPKDGDAYIQRALAKCYIGEFGSAIIDYNIGLEWGGTKALAFQGRALAKWLLQSTELDSYGAMEDFASAIRADAEEIRPVAQRAVIFYMERGGRKRRFRDYNGAFHDFEKAVAAEPENYNALEDLADMMQKIGNPQEAIIRYGRVIELNPERDRAYFSRGRAKQSLHDFVGALEDYDKALEMNEGHAPYLLDRADLKRIYMHDFEGAIEDYSDLIRSESFLVDAHMGRGDAKRMLEDYDGAMADMNSALGLSPESATAYSWRADIKDDMGDYHGALADYDKASKLDDQLRCAYLNRGITKLWADDLDGALADFEAAISTDSSCGEGYAGRAEVERIRKNFPKALSDCTKAIELDPFEADFYDDRAGIKISSGDIAGAVADYESAGELDPRLFSPRVILYALHVLAGDCQKAEAVQQEMELILYGTAPEVWPTQLGRFLTGAMTETNLMGYAAKGHAGRQATKLCKAHFAIGIKCLAEGQKTEAREHFEKALETDKKQLTEYELAAEALLKLGK